MNACIAGSEIRKRLLGFRDQSFRQQKEETEKKGLPTMRAERRAGKNQEPKDESEDGKARLSHL